MERLGIYIFIFFFLGIAFFERVRTNGETGSLWAVLLRNLIILLLAVAGYLFWGADLGATTADRELLSTAKSVLQGGGGEPGARGAAIMDILLPCLFCGGATLIAAVGIWELKIRLWCKLVVIGIFNLLIYPVFSQIQGADGFLGKAGFYDHAGALLIWALPACFLLGFRMLAAQKAIPAERKHDLKGVKVLPGIKHRFLFSRGIGFTMIFLVLNATTLVDHSWVISKTLTLIPASFTIIFCNLLFFGLFGRNKMERMSYAPPFFAIMGALLATQACNQYLPEQAILAGVVATFLAMLYLRVTPMKVRVWDPICAVPIFLVGGFAGILMASITPAAKLPAQLLGVIVCLVIGFGSGALLSLPLSRFTTGNRNDDSSLSSGTELTSP